MRKWHLFPLLAGLLYSGGALANSCATLLAPPDRGSLDFRLATVNVDGTALVATGSLVYVPPIRRAPYIYLPARWQTSNGAPANLEYSTVHPPLANFLVETIAVSLTVAASPGIRLTLLSRGSQQLTFSGTCSANGIIHGTSGSADILISVTPNRGTN